jgi:hypothetical protein
MGISIEILSAISAAQSIPSASAAGLTTATVFSFVGFLAGIFALLLHELGTRARRASVPVYFIGSGFTSALAATVCILASTQPIFATITALASLLSGLLGVVTVLWIEDRPPSGV